MMLGEPSELASSALGVLPGVIGGPRGTVAIVGTGSVTDLMFAFISPADDRERLESSATVSGVLILVSPGSSAVGVHCSPVVLLVELKDVWGALSSFVEGVSLVAELVVTVTLVEEEEDSVEPDEDTETVRSGCKQGFTLSSTFSGFRSV